ncbi:MAG TPA: sigma-70 family RNA polymerase sigma factor [Bacteroidales bacterium]|nr:sigma-70 family RNA polymerase sigma factor [Bacteroidales bacterium]
MSKIFKDEEIIAGLRKRDNQVIKFIYDRDFNKVMQMILANSGSENDAEDIFQESLIIVFKKLREEEKFELTSTFSTYIYSINRLLWLKKLRNSKRMNIGRLDREKEDYIEFEEPPPVLDKDLRMAIYQKNLKLIPDDCQKILTLTGQDKSAKEIADTLGFRSDSYVRKRRHFCKEFLVNRIKEDQDYRDMMED